MDTELQTFIQRLAEAGALAVYIGQSDAAEKIFNTIGKVAPNLPVHILGKSMNYQANGDLTNAILAIESADLDQFEEADQQLLKAMLAFFLKLDGQGSRFDNLKDEVLRAGTGAEAENLLNDIRN